MGILKNSSIVVSGILISNILAYVFHIYAGRMLGPAEYGVFGALLSLLIIFALPAGAISSAITKFSAKYNAEKNNNKIGILRKELSKRVWIMGIIIAIIISIASSYIADYLNISSRLPVIIVGITLIFSVILPVNRGILQGMKKFKILSFNNIIEAASRLIVLIILILLGTGANGALLSYGLGYFIAFLFIFPFITETRVKKEERIEMKPVYHFIILVLVVNLLIQSLINLPTILIKHYYSSEFTGLWTAALTIARMSLFVTGGITMVMFSEVAEKQEKSEKKRVFKKALALTLLSSTGIAIVFTIFPQSFILMLYGKSFLGAVVFLRWLGVAMIGISVLSLYASYWLARM